MSEEYKRLNPKCRISMYIGYIISYAILLVIIFVSGYFTKTSVSESEYELYALVSVIILIVALIYIIIAPIIYYRRYRYMITSDKIDVRYGIIIIRHILVPLERVHQVEVVRGPINNMFGLANVNLTTAGGMATIEYLEVDKAESIAEELNELINKIIKDRKRNDY